MLMQSEVSTSVVKLQAVEMRVKCNINRASNGVFSTRLNVAMRICEDVQIGNRVVFASLFQSPRVRG